MGLDGTNWPRPAARTSAERTWEYRPLPGWPQSGVVPAWAYQWLVAVPDVAGSWVLPLDVSLAMRMYMPGSAGRKSSPVAKGGINGGQLKVPAPHVS